MSDLFLTYRVGVLMTLAAISPAAADWLNEPARHDCERGDITVQNVIWMAIAAAGAFVIAVILYNKFRTKANNLDVDNPGAIPAALPTREIAAGLKAQGLPSPHYLADQEPRRHRRPHRAAIEHHQNHRHLGQMHIRIDLADKP